MTAYLPLIIDGVVAALLIATIVYAVMLNRQLSRLRDGHAELADYIKGLNDATANAEAAVRGLRKAAGETGEQLQRAVDKGAALRDELQFMLETGNALADRLGGGSGGGGLGGGMEKDRAELRGDAPRRDVGRQEMSPRAQPAARPSLSGAARSPLIDEGLMAAARAEAARGPGGGDNAPLRAMSDNASLRAMSDSASLRAMGENPPPSRGAGGGSSGGTSSGESDGLSRAERELLQALESRR